MINRPSGSRCPLFVLLLSLAAGTVAPAGDAPAGIVWQSWGREPFEQARQQDRPLLLMLADDACESCRARELAARADPTLAAVLGAGLVLVRAERLDRPDLDDLFSLLADAAGSGLQEADDAEPGPRYPLLVVLLPDGRPFGVTRLGAPAEARGVLLGLASLFRNERPQAEEQATQLTETLRAGQKPTPAQRSLGPDVLDTALKGWADSADASPGVRLLAEETARTERADLRLLLERGLGRVAGEPEPPSLAPAALRLVTLARGQQVTGDSSRAASATGLAQWIAKRATPEGLFCASPADDRAISGWNGLVLSALAVSSQALDRPADLKLARAAAKSIVSRLEGPADLPRTLAGSALGGSAFLEDYAFLAQGFLDLHQATQDRFYLVTAQQLVDKALARFYDARGDGFFSTTAAHEPLPARPKTAFDGALPSGNGVMAWVLLRLGRAGGETRYAGLAQRTLQVFAGDLERSPRGLATLATALGESLGRPTSSLAPVPRFPAQAAAGPVRFAVVARPGSVRPGQPFDLRLTMIVAADWRVVAPQPGLEGLLGLAVSVPGEGLEVSPVRYPTAKRVRESMGGGEFGALDGESLLLVRLRYRPEVKPGERWVRVRVRFQPCGIKGCEAPDSVVLDAPMTVVP